MRKLIPLMLCSLLLLPAALPAQAQDDEDQSKAERKAEARRHKQEAREQEEAAPEERVHKSRKQRRIESATEEQVTPAEVDAGALEGGEVSGKDVRGMTDSLKPGKAGKKPRKGRSEHPVNNYESANRETGDARLGGGDAEPQGDENAHVMGKLGQGGNKAPLGQGQDDGSGGPTSDGGADAHVNLGKVGGKGVDKFGKGRKGPHRPRGNDDGGAPADQGPQGEQAEHVMNKLDAHQGAPITSADQAGGRGADGGAIGKNRKSVTADDLNKDRLNAGDQVKEPKKGKEPGMLEKIGNLFPKGTPPPQKAPGCAPNCGKPVIPPFQGPKKREAGATAAAGVDVQDVNAEAVREQTKP